MSKLSAMSGDEITEFVDAGNHSHQDILDLHSEMLAMRERIARQDSLISHLVGPSGLHVDEPGTYTLNTTLFSDGSGFSRTWTKANPEHDCYPPLSWREAKERENEVQIMRERIAVLESALELAIGFLTNKPTYTGHRTSMRWKLEEALKESEVPSE